jgi:hypothetical protein
VSQSWIERVRGEGVGDAERALALALVVRRAAGRDRRKGGWIVVVSVVLSTAVDGRSGTASGFRCGLALVAAARLAGAVGEAIVGVEC